MVPAWTNLDRGWRSASIRRPAGCDAWRVKRATCSGTEVSGREGLVERIRLRGNSPARFCNRHGGHAPGDSTDPPLREGTHPEGAGAHRMLSAAHERIVSGWLVGARRQTLGICAYRQTPPDSGSEHPHESALHAVALVRIDRQVRSPSLANEGQRRREPPELDQPVMDLKPGEPQLGVRRIGPE